MDSRRHILGLCLAALAILPSMDGWAWTPLAVTNDPLVRMPGTQPRQVTLESITRCMNCHSGYDAAVEPGRNWMGSMMGQTARDPVFYACFTVAAQDSIWALGNPNAADICMRCHYPKGWLEGRSDPVNASLMTGSDYDGVQCDFCHSLRDPFCQDTYTGVRESSDWTNYWDESNKSGTPSQPAAAATYVADSNVLSLARFFNGLGFYGTNNRPVGTNYLENGGGQFYVAVTGTGAKRAPFADANANHEFLYSRYHKSKYFCQTCHDVSNPALANLGVSGTNKLPSELNSAYSYFHVERTFSEYMLSAYATHGGVAGSGGYDPGVFPTSRTNDYIASCQDCHMRYKVGRGCNKSAGIIRPTGSTEHPNSGQPVHELTGGNMWVPYLLASSVVGSPNYDSVNASLLRQGPAALTLDFAQGEALDALALLSAVGRAQTNLQLAASITNASYDPFTGSCSFRVLNHTGHKLISGFPEGRRMFVNIKAYANGVLIYEVNPYDSAVGTLRGLSSVYSPSSPPLGRAEACVDELVYEMHPKSAVTGEDETFHFALATGRYKDNRIPPRGFRIGEAAARLAEPVWHGASDTNYFTPAEYAGGYDEVALGLPVGSDRVEIRLYYQATSREYVEFLRDEINGTASTLTGTGAGGDPAYLIQTDSWFAKLKAWGNTIWQLWDRNKNVPGAAPALMASAVMQLDTSDTDLDGIPAYWEVRYFGGPTNANPGDDTDRDTVNNYREFVALTLPTNGQSALHLDLLGAILSNSVRVSVAFTSEFARLYALQFSSNLPPNVAWTNVAPFELGGGAMTLRTHTNTAEHGLYRISVKLPSAP